MPYSGNPTVANFKTDMKNLTAQMQGSLEANFGRQADELMENMRGAVPVLTGKLKASIRKRNMTRQRGTLQTVTFLVMAGGPATTRRSKTGNVYDYALGTEFGTVNEKAEPFFYSTARRYQQMGRESAQKTVDEVIEENNRVRALRSSNYDNVRVTSSRGGKGGAIKI